MHSTKKVFFSYTKCLLLFTSGFEMVLCIINILIFVFFFLIDAIISWLLYRYAKSQIQQHGR